MGASLSQLSSESNDDDFLRLPIADCLNDALAASMSKRLPACVAADEEAGDIGKSSAGSSDSFQIVRALSELLSQTEDEKSVKASPLVSEQS